TERLVSNLHSQIEATGEQVAGICDGDSSYLGLHLRVHGISAAINPFLVDLIAIQTKTQTITRPSGQSYTIWSLSARGSVNLYAGARRVGIDIERTGLWDRRWRLIFLRYNSLRRNAPGGQIPWVVPLLNGSLNEIDGQSSSVIRGIVLDHTDNSCTGDEGGARRSRAYREPIDFKQRLRIGPLA